jgi:hypothetical protein
MTEIACPVCHAGALARGEGKLEQSGDSYLPTVVWSCACCGYARFEPALGRRWRPEHAPACEAPVAAAPAPVAGARTPSRTPAPADPSRRAA